MSKLNLAKARRQKDQEAEEEARRRSESIKPEDDPQFL